MKAIKMLGKSVLFIALIQAVRIFLVWGIELFVRCESFSYADRMVKMSVMIVMSGAVVLYARYKKTSFSLFPEHFGKFYIIATVIAAVILITTPSNFTGGYQAILLLVYGSLVTPVFEELIFRGYLWNKMKSVFSKEFYVCICSIALFTFWHIGYMIPQIIEENWTSVLWKLAAGLAYGTVLGLVRLKCKNCYITMLIHGVMNVFSI